jgi:repressor LexA
MSDNLHEIIGKNIRTLRAWRNITATELAKALKISQSTISDWETGKKVPRAGNMQKLAQYFNVRITDLMSSGRTTASIQMAGTLELIDLEALLHNDARLVFKNRLLTQDEKKLVERLVSAALNQEAFK